MSEAIDLNVGRSSVGAMPAPGAPVRTIAVCSGKGGVGKTSASVNLAVSYAQLGRAVVLLDADLAMANADVLLGLKPKGTLAHVLDGECELEDILLDGPAGVTLVPASSGVSRLANLDAVESAGLIQGFSALSRPTEVLIVDVAAGISESVLMFARAVQEVVVVVCDEPASMTDAYALIKVLHREHRVERFQILASMVDSAADGQALFRKMLQTCDRFLDVSLTLLGSVPRDEYMVKAIRSRKPVCTAFPASRSARAFKDIANRADSRSMAMTPWGGIEFFVDRMVASS